MMSASQGEGVMEKQTEYGRLRELFTSNQFQMQTREKGVKKSEKFCGHHIWKLP